MQFQVTEIEFDFDNPEPLFEGEIAPSQEYRDAFTEETIGTIWEADNEDDLVEEITCATGWCIKSINYRHILS